MFDIEWEKLGTIHGGWYVPSQMDLSEDSIIYSGGVGEDISFDLLLSEKYKSNIILIDPTIRSKIHYNEIKNYYVQNLWNFSGDIQSDYFEKIYYLDPSLQKIKFLDVGLWHKKDVLKFYKQDNPAYTSQSLIDNMFGKEYDSIPVNSIRNIMVENNHDKINLLKLDIEGAEIQVLNQMLDDEIYPRYLCVEFDLCLKNKDIDNDTEKVIKRLIDNGYEILINDNLNITFDRIKNG